MSTTSISATQESVSKLVEATQENSVLIEKEDSITKSIASTQTPDSVSVAKTDSISFGVIESTQASVALALEVDDTPSLAIASEAEALRVVPLLARFLQSSPFDADRFTDYANGVYNEDCWANGLDLSGVNLEGTATTDEDARRCALIGRNCAITADHFGPRHLPGPFTVTFTDPAGDKFTYTIGGQSPLMGFDVSVITFTANVSPTLTSYPIADSDDVPIGEYLISSRSRREADTGDYTAPAAQRAMIEKVSSRDSGAASISFIRSALPTEAQVNHVAAANGDSSDPLFILNSLGRLELVTCFTTPTSGSDLAESATLAAIDAWLASNGAVRLAQESSLLS